MKEINITDIDGFRLGNAQDVAGGTGCTVVICDRGARAGVSVMGGGPATRETDLLNPTKMVQEILVYACREAVHTVWMLQPES